MDDIITNFPPTTMHPYDSHSNYLEFMCETCHNITRTNNFNEVNRDGHMYYQYKCSYCDNDVEVSDFIKNETNTNQIDTNKYYKLKPKCVYKSNLYMGIANFDNHVYDIFTSEGASIITFEHTSGNNLNMYCDGQRCGYDDYNMWSLCINSSHGCDFTAYDFIDQNTGEHLAYFTYNNTYLLVEGGSAMDPVFLLTESLYGPTNYYQDNYKYSWWALEEVEAPTEAPSPSPSPTPTSAPDPIIPNKYYKLINHGNGQTRQQGSMEGLTWCDTNGTLNTGSESYSSFEFIKVDPNISNCYYIKSTESGKYIHANGTTANSEVNLSNNAETQWMVVQSDTWENFVKICIYNSDTSTWNNALGINANKLYAAVQGGNGNSWWKMEEVEGPTEPPTEESSRKQHLWLDLSGIDGRPAPESGVKPTCPPGEFYNDVSKIVYRPYDKEVVVFNYVPPIHNV